MKNNLFIIVLFCFLLSSCWGASNQILFDKDNMIVYSPEGGRLVELTVDIDSLDGICFIRCKKNGKVCDRIKLDSLDNDYYFTPCEQNFNDKSLPIFIGSNYNIMNMSTAPDGARRGVKFKINNNGKIVDISYY